MINCGRSKPLVDELQGTVERKKDKAQRQLFVIYDVTIPASCATIIPMTLNYIIRLISLLKPKENYHLL